MTNVHTSIRITAFAIAAIVVSGSGYALGSYSNAKVAASVIAAKGPAVADSAHTAIAPSRIDVFGKRGVRTAA